MKQKGKEGLIKITSESHVEKCILRVIVDDIAEAALAVNGFHMHLGVEKRKWQNPDAGKPEGAGEPMEAQDAIQVDKSHDITIQTESGPMTVMDRIRAINEERARLENLVRETEAKRAPAVAKVKTAVRKPAQPFIQQQQQQLSEQ